MTIGSIRGSRGGETAKRRSRRPAAGLKIRWAPRAFYAALGVAQEGLRLTRPNRNRLPNELQFIQ